MANLHDTLTARFTDACEISDIANHGIQGGFNGFIWTHEVVDFFDNHEEEIYSYLNDCGFGLHDFTKQNPGSTISTLKVDMVWTMVELWCQAQNTVNEMILVATAD